MNTKLLLIAITLVCAAPMQTALAGDAGLFVSCASDRMPDRTEVAQFFAAGSFGVEEQREGLIRAAHRACRNGASGVRFVRADATDEQAGTHIVVRAIALRDAQ